MKRFKVEFDNVCRGLGFVELYFVPLNCNKYFDVFLQHYYSRSVDVKLQ